MNVKEILSKYTKHQNLIKWIEELVTLCEPKDLMFCDGSDEEYKKLTMDGVKEKRWLELKKRPNSILVRSSPDDVARVEQFTFICSKDKKDAGPTNNWKAPDEMHKELDGLFKGCMKGRTMYIIPFSMGPVGSNIAHIGVEVTDSSYVVFNMKIMTRMGKKVIDQLGENGPFIKCLHSVGKPILKPEDDFGWPSNPTKRITHFPEERSIKSFGSGYGGNALLGKKCFALRIASVMARDEGWLAEHMLILKITNPEGKVHYITGAFPSACGKTNLAMIDPPKEFKGWKVECIGDDIAWMKFNKEDGRLYAINPENGFFGVAPGTSSTSNKNAMESITKNSIFTNVALTDDGDVWWEGMTKEKPKHLVDWLGKDWTPESKTPASHPNARFTAPLQQCPIASPDCDNPKGVPIDAMLFGGRRESTIPLVAESFDWNHGVFYGCALSSEVTAAADVTSKIRHDPFAMLPFCGYHMGDYFNHWVQLGKKHKDDKLPKIYMVNWFRKDEKGNWLWPGYSDNFRVLAWIFDRLEGKTDNSIDTPWGKLPKVESLNLDGLNLDKQILKDVLLNVNNKALQVEVEGLKEYFKIFDTQMPKEILDVLDGIDKKSK